MVIGKIGLFLQEQLKFMNAIRPIRLLDYLSEVYNIDILTAMRGIVVFIGSKQDVASQRSHRNNYASNISFSSLSFWLSLRTVPPVNVDDDGTDFGTVHSLIYITMVNSIDILTAMRGIVVFIGSKQDVASQRSHSNNYASNISFSSLSFWLSLRTVPPVNVDDDGTDFGSTAAG